MCRIARVIAVFPLLLLLLGGSLIAGPLDDGKRAYETGDYGKALQLLEPLAKAGDAHAQFYIGHLYRLGAGVTQDSSEAFRWYEKSARQGYHCAQNSLAIMYSEGRGVEKNLAEAVKWWRKAAEQGHPTAQFNVGRAYATGEGGYPQDDMKAVFWFRQSADQDYVMAKNALGWMYQQGRGVKQDHTEALKWYRRAVHHEDAQEDAVAYFNLGVMYDFGFGVPQNYEVAANWYRRAVEHGLGEVQFALSFAEGMKAYLAGDYKGASKHFSEPKIVQNRAQYMLVLLRNQSEAGGKHDALALAW